MTAGVLEYVCEVTGARSAARGDVIQSLWSGYGEIVRVHLEGASATSVIVKRVTPPTRASHPRGRSSDRGHQRKLRSYEVEAAFYERFASRTPEPARVAKTFGVTATQDGWLFVLEDLDAAGFDLRRRQVSEAQLTACLEWLATFHAAFLGEAPDNLWPEGTYWHLATRPDELEVMPRGPLRAAADAIDARLGSARYRTLVHGDAKLANFCFSSGGAVAAVDFQYVGGGAGVKDVAYLLSCLPNDTLEAHAPRFLDSYFRALRHASVDGGWNADAVEEEWRALHPFAVADFERFLAGWAPGHQKRDRYAARLTKQALAQL